MKNKIWKIILIFLAASLIFSQSNVLAKTTKHHTAKHCTHHQQKNKQKHKYVKKHKKIHTALKKHRHISTPPTPQEVFINEMVEKYKFNRKQLTILFKHINVNHEIIPEITHPFEGKAWYVYRHYFVKDERAERGALFWLNNEKVLDRASKQYGVPSSIIVAILGVETDYGRGQGKYPVLDTLYTLAFYYPPRADFFRQQLVEYLLLTRDLAIDPTSIRGSYAGAMGFPQFMPSSYRYYAVDYSGNGKIDLFHNTADVIGSVANYFKENGWERGQPVVVQARVVGNGYQTLINNTLKTRYQIAEFEKHGVVPEQNVSDSMAANLMAFKGYGENEYWLGLHNFYVITRYNPSPAYAMAVYQLAGKIEDKYRELKKGIK
jgi:membrane-bound lytic murein transglycosylase B